MTYILRFVRLGTVFSVHFERASLLYMPIHYPGHVHCNSLSNPVRTRSCASTTGDIGGHWEYECSPTFWAGHCAVHGYSPTVVVLCSVPK